MHAPATDRFSSHRSIRQPMKFAPFQPRYQNHIKHTSNPLFIRPRKKKNVEKLRSISIVYTHSPIVAGVCGLDYYSLEFLWACHSLAHSIVPPVRSVGFFNACQTPTPFNTYTIRFSNAHRAYGEICMAKYAGKVSAAVRGVGNLRPL